MKNHHSMSPFSRPRGFTLVELLVVITIIGILVGLTIPAVIYARIIVKQYAITADLKQLEMACQAYKEKFGEYPPDFAGVANPDASVSGPARNAVLRHIRKAFPRCTAVGDWNGFLAANGNMMSVQFTPQMALSFWLGGRRDPTTGLPTGFSANPANPFDDSPSRIGPFFDFDLNRLLFNGRYWPQGAAGTMTTGSIVYFRAENGNYTVDGSDCTGPDHSKIKCVPGEIESLSPTKEYERVLPAADWRITNTPPYSWVNSKSFQIFSAGLDTSYALVDGGTVREPLQYPNPTGDNYREQTYDDITNFSDGTLGDAMP